MTIAATRIAMFDTWEAGYGGATVQILIAGTNQLAAVFTDPAMTQQAANPQVLIMREIGGVSCGKFAQSLYTAAPYQIDINSTDLTGVQTPPISRLDGEDASYAVARSRRYDYPRRITDILANPIRVEWFGEWGTSAATNTATLNRAIGAASEEGGAIVEIPAGSWPITYVTLPAGVRLRGAGMSATVLTSTEGQEIISVGGAKSGLIDITIDGVNLAADSVGLYGASADDITLDNVLIKRFDRGLRFKGGEQNVWWELHIENCDVGAELLGDVNDGAGLDGDKWESNHWIGGHVIQCTTTGLLLSYVDRIVQQNTFESIRFEDNTGDAVEINGARGTAFSGCSWKNNTSDLVVHDDTDDSVEDNTVIGLWFSRCTLSGGSLSFDDTCADVKFDRVDFVDVDWILSLPTTAIVLIDCTEDAQVTVAGDSTKLVRSSLGNVQEVTGVTTDANATAAFSITLEHGQIAYVEAKIEGNQRNGEDYAIFHISMAARRPPAHLSYDNQTANFTLGKIVTGQTSGATARITADVDGGSSGTLHLRDVSGEFEDNEIITDTSGGSAQVNGVLVPQNVFLAVSGSLPYDAQAGNFTVGQTITGGTSGSKAKITADSDGGGAGTLTIRDITGPFLDNEAITDPLGGSALVNIATTGLTLSSLSQVLRTALKTDAAWDAFFAVSGGTLQIKVQGAASKDVEWTVRANVMVD